LNRVVLDTNVTIAAFFWRGHPRTVYDLVLAGKITMLLSEEMEKEFVRVLGYPKFRLSPMEILPLIKNVRNNAELITTTSRLSVIAADPTDNIFLECAVDGKADAVITGDRHILNLGAYGGIQIVRPKDFLVKEGYAQNG